MPEERLPQRRRPDTSLTREEKRLVIAGLRGLRGAARSFVADIARQAQEARGRLDDDVYGIVRVTLEALAHNAGSPPPLVFAVTHYQTGEVKQVGFLPTGVTRMPRVGRFVTNDPSYRPPGAIGSRTPPRSRDDRCRPKSSPYDPTRTRSSGCWPPRAA
ncbi:MAG: hypothetical protein QGI83_07790 [Candidatus Latescibacteria bacterium]|nr:hypothetical protein [Candidatus Latescibacterota bacterium]